MTPFVFRINMPEKGVGMESTYDVYDVYEVTFGGPDGPVSFRTWACPSHGPYKTALVDEARDILRKGGMDWGDIEAAVPDDTKFVMEKVEISGCSPMGPMKDDSWRPVLAVPFVGLGLWVAFSEKASQGWAFWACFAAMILVAMALDMITAVLVAKAESGRACLFKSLAETEVPSCYRYGSTMSMAKSTAAATALAVGAGEKNMGIIPDDIRKALPADVWLSILDCLSYRKHRTAALSHVQVKSVPEMLRVLSLVFFGSVRATALSCASAASLTWMLVAIWPVFALFGAACGIVWVAHRLLSKPVSACDMACIKDGREG